MAIIDVSKCIGCQLCKRVCPVNAICGEKKEVHKINVIRCVDCMACGYVCPKAAISNNEGKIIEKKKKEELMKPNVDITKCSACQICVDVCSFDCLSISRPKFVGDVEAYAIFSGLNCVGCNLCQVNCPIDAITMEVRP